MIVGALIYQCLYAGEINMFCAALRFVFVVEGDPYRRPPTTSLPRAFVTSLISATRFSCVSRQLKYQHFPGTQFVSLGSCEDRFPLLEYVIRTKNI
jgi:hypothetical protein